MDRRQFLHTLALVPLIAGCQQTRVAAIRPPDFNNLPQLNLAVGVITVEPLHDNRTSYPRIEGLSPYPLQGIIQQWSDDVFVPAGGQGTLNIQILTASLIEEKLPTKRGFAGLFSNEQSEAYHGKITLAFQVQLPDYNGTINIHSTAVRSVSENASLREREQVWVDIGTKMVNDIDQKLRQNLQQELPRLLLAQ